MKPLFFRLRPHVQAYVFLLGVAALTPTAALAARFSGVSAEGRLLQTPATLSVHFAAREEPLFMHKPPASLLLQPLAMLAAAQAETDFRHGDPLAADGETLSAAAAEPGVASAVSAETPGAAPFCLGRTRALAEDSLATLRSVPVTFAEDPLAALHSAPAAFASGDNPAPDIALGRFYTRLEQLRKLLETLRHLRPPHIGVVDPQYARPVIAVSHLRLSHPGTADTQFSGAPEDSRLLQSSPVLRIHFAARETPSFVYKPPASLLLQPPDALYSASHAGEIDTQFNGVPAEDRSAALRSAPAASAVGDLLAHEIAPGRFHARLEQVRKLLETLRHLRPLRIGADSVRFRGAPEDSRLLQSSPVLRIHFAAREFLPPAASPHPASLLLQPPDALYPASHAGEIDTQFNGVPAEDRSAALRSAPAASAVGDLLAHEIAPGSFHARLEQVRKLLETLRYLRPLRIGADSVWFRGAPEDSRLLQSSAALRIHFAAREKSSFYQPPASLLLQPPSALAAAQAEIDFRHRDPLAADSEASAAAVAEQGATSAAPAEAPGAAPFPREQTRALAEDPPAALRSAQLRCAVTDRTKSAELSLTICGGAS